MEIYLIGVLAFLAVGGLGWALVGGGESDGGSKRARSIAGGRSGPQRGGAKKSSRDELRERLAKIEAETAGKKKSKGKSLKGMLEQAGLSLKPKTFLMICGGAGLSVGLVLFIRMQSPLIAGGAAVFAGVGLPFFVLNYLAGNRRKKFLAEFPNALEAIVRGVKSGLPLNECLQLIAKETTDPLRGEVELMVDALAAGVPFERAVEKFADRNPLPEVNFFRVVLVLQQRTGGSLAEVLGNLAKVLRERKLLREKVKALASEAKASAWIIGSLPVVVAGFVSLTTPGYLMPLIEEPMGRTMLMGAAFWMSCGVFAMSRMINFKF